MVVCGSRGVSDMVEHRTAMRIASRKATLHRLPPAGAKWEWGDVVNECGDDDELVAKEAAHAVRGLLTQHPDGRYETTERLETYLKEKHGIELTGRCEEQARLPIDTVTGRETQVMTDGSGASDSGGESAQVGLDGEDAEDAVAEQAAQSELERRAAQGEHGGTKHVEAREDARQATVDSYASRVHVGPLARRTGDAYGGCGTRVSVDA